MGWGDIGVGPGNVVHYAFAQHGAGADPGDVYYTRSSDNGTTWSVPLKLNTDATTRGQWQPSLAVTPAGQVFVGWYDERNTTLENGYQRFGRLSTDNGLTWQPDSDVSDVVIPKPLQPDPGIQPCYAGDYDR
jgi:Neuraminidase (sialidase)